MLKPLLKPSLKTALLGLLMALVVCALYLNYGKQPTAIDHNTYSYHLLQPGPYQVQSEDVEFIDSSRPTQASGDYPGSDSRRLLTRIWWPLGDALQQRQPLLIYSHGFLSSRVGGSYLAENLASHGYIVAAADYPLSNYDAPGPQLVEDVVNQPGDVSFIIDQLLQRSHTEGDILYHAIDESRIAAAGLSLGGMTTSLVAFHPTMRDAHIDAAISIAGPSFMFSRRYYEHRRLPFMMIASPIDAMLEYTANALSILKNVDNAVLVTIAKASHAGFSALATALRWMSNPDQIGCWMIKSKVDTPPQQEWFDLIGTPEQGILHDPAPPVCATNPLPATMNPIRQQWMTTLAVSSFLQSQFAVDADERQRHHNFLLQQLAYENPEVTVELAAPHSHSRVTVH